jgi:AraC family transcriptional regulator
MDEAQPRSNDAVSPEAARACPTAVTAACAAMRVTYVPLLATVEHEHPRDALEIVIAADEFVFHANYRPIDGDCSPAHEAILASRRERADVVVIALDRAFFQNSARGALGGNAPMVTGHYCAADTLMKELGNVLLRDFRMRRIPSPAYLESLAGVIAVHLAAHHYARRPTAAVRGLPRHKLQRALRFIDEHIAAAIRVADLAGTAHMSLFHFARMFKEATGVPPHRYITSRRVDRAKSLLSETDLPLVDVAAEAGFQTQGHFTCVFRKLTGVTPGAYRVSCGEASVMGSRHPLV